MAWDDAQAILERLRGVLNEFDWPAADGIVDELLSRLKREQTPFPADMGRRFASELRRKRRFKTSERFAEALLLAGVTDPQVRRQYVQALIDQGTYAAADDVIGRMLQGLPDDHPEWAEAHGLRGRLFKQLYVNANDPKSPVARRWLELAVQEYGMVYRRNPQVHTWHGINLAAVLERAKRDGVSIGENFPSPQTLAEEISSALAGRENPYAWDLGTLMESWVARDNLNEAVLAAARYVTAEGADAFELASTERQLLEVWRLNNETPPGSMLLPLLHSALLTKIGGRVTLPPHDARKELASTRKAASNARLEAVLGADRMQTLKWYQLGLECAASIARIENKSGRGIGTGWLVRAEDFFPDRAGLLLLTNKHVISPLVNNKPYRPSPSQEALLPDRAYAHFQILKPGKPIPVGEVVWSSADLTDDATFLTLPDLPPDAKPLDLYRYAVRQEVPPSRVYVIGHPDGRDIEFSLHDNEMLGCNDSLIHYRAPTEGGSSGSPVFEAEDWEVIALHHAGGSSMPRLDRSDELYEANEGIAIKALQALMQKVPTAGS